MASRDLVHARFPDMAQGYESFYLRAADPAGGQGFWIRYTIHRAPRRPPTGSLWFTFFEADATPVAAKRTVETPLAGGQSWIRIEDATLGPDGARGGIELPSGLEVGWDLSYSGADLFHHLPRGWMYAAPLPRTKPVSVYPTAKLSGTLVVGDRTVSVDGWPGMVGHNWGSEHAERWIWLHGTFEDDSWLDVVLARIKVGRWTTPWTGFGALCLGGDRHRLGGLARVRATRVDEHPDHLTFTMTGDELRVLGHVSAPKERFVGWVYADPDGSGHDVAHCSIADLDLTVEQPGLPTRTLRAAGTAAYELGMREHDHGIQIQPFPDG